MKFLINAREILFQALLDNVDRISRIDFEGKYPEKLKEFFPRKFIKQLKKKKYKKTNRIRVLFSESVNTDVNEDEKMLNIIICGQYKDVNENELIRNFDLIMVAVNIFDLYLLINQAFSALEREFKKAALIVNKALLSAVEISKIPLDILKEQNKGRKNNDELFLTVEFNENEPVLILTTSMYANTLIEELIVKRNLRYHLLVVKQIKPILNDVLKKLHKSKIVYIVAPYPLDRLLIRNLVNFQNMIIVSLENISSEIPMSFDLFEVFNDFFRKVSVL